MKRGQKDTHTYEHRDSMKELAKGQFFEKTQTRINIFHSLRHYSNKPLCGIIRASIKITVQNLFLFLFFFQLLQYNFMTKLWLSDFFLFNSQLFNKIAVPYMVYIQYSHTLLLTTLQTWAGQYKNLF